MKIHVCLFDKDCRRVGAPKRMRISAFRWHVGIAFTPGDRFAGKIEDRPKWIWVRPRSDKIC